MSCIDMKTKEREKCLSIYFVCHEGCIYSDSLAGWELKCIRHFDCNLVFDSGGPRSYLTVK